MKVMTCQKRSATIWTLPASLLMTLAMLVSTPPVMALGDKAVDLVAGHRVCFKTGKKDLKVRGVLDLFTPQFGFSDSCTIWETVMMCAPAHKTVIELRTKKKKQDKKLQPTEPLQFDGFLGQFDSVCYRMKCKEPRPRDVELLDQFGVRTIKKLKPFVVCTPAIKACTDAERTIFAGGPGSCSKFDGDPDQCAQAFESTENGYAASCFADNGNCRGCGNGLVYVGENGGGFELECTNSCVSCLDPSRTVLAKGIGVLKGACQQFTDQASCEEAWHIGALGAATCYWAGSECRGCGAPNELDNQCANTCQPGMRGNPTTTTTSTTTSTTQATTSTTTSSTSSTTTTTAPTTTTTTTQPTTTTTSTSTTQLTTTTTSTLPDLPCDSTNFPSQCVGTCTVGGQVGQCDQGTSSCECFIDSP